MSNININFQARNLQWRSYITKDILPTTKRVELIEKIEFIAIALNPEHKAFVVQVVALNISFDISDEMHSLRKAQRAHLKVDEAPIEVFNKYANFADVLLPKLDIELLKHMNINNYTIKLVDD